MVVSSLYIYTQLIFFCGNGEGATYWTEYAHSLSIYTLSLFYPETVKLHTSMQEHDVVYYSYFFSRSETLEKRYIGVGGKISHV